MLALPLLRQQRMENAVQRKTFPVGKLGREYLLRHPTNGVTTLLN